MKTSIINLSMTIVFIAFITSGKVYGQDVGSSAPDFTLSTDEGSSFKLSDQKGKVVFIFFFGYACPHCLGNGNNTETGIYNVYKSNNDFVAIGIDTWNGNASGVANFKSSTGLTYPLCYEGSQVVTEYKTTYDRIVVIDKDGIIQYKSSANSTSDVVKTASNVIMPLLNANFLSVSNTSLSLEADANSMATFTINSNVYWSISGLESWLSADNTEGNGDASITLTAEENTSSEPRNATLTIAGTNLSDKTVSVTQNGIPLILTVSASSLTLDREANSMATFTINSNVNWSISGLESWLSLDITEGSGDATLTLTAEENTLSASRNATLTISGTGVSDRFVTITQFGMDVLLSVSDTTLTLEAEANSTETFFITSNTDWTISGLDSWLSANNTEGSGNATITLTAEENTLSEPRTDTISITGVGASDLTIIITQEVSTVNVSNENGSGVSIYPNPVSNSLYIKGLQNNATGRIYNANGGLVFSSDIVENGKINVSLLPSGIYLLKLESDAENKVLVKRFVKK